MRRRTKRVRVQQKKINSAKKHNLINLKCKTIFNTDQISALGQQNIWWGKETIN